MSEDQKSSKKAIPKGHLIFEEGDESSSMYLLQKGSIRVFKKKGNSKIEIGTLKPGELIGELSFLDGQPRSASVEALVDSEVYEISAQTYTNATQNIPDWLKALLRTVSGRLRNATNQIKQLEQSTSVLNYGKDGQKQSSYQYIQSIELLKILSSFFTIKGVKKLQTNHSEIPQNLLEKFSCQIFGIPGAKLHDVLWILEKINWIEINRDDKLNPKIKTLNDDLILEFISYFHGEYLKEESKKTMITESGFIALEWIALEASETQLDTKTGLTKINIVSINQKIKSQNLSYKEIPMDGLNELEKSNFTSKVLAQSNEEIFVQIKNDFFQKIYLYYKLIHEVENLNKAKNNTKKVA